MVLDFSLSCVKRLSTAKSNIRQKWLHTYYLRYTHTDDIDDDDDDDDDDDVDVDDDDDDDNTLIFYSIDRIEDFRRKACMVAGGHMIGAPTIMTYPSMVSHETNQIALTITALNDLKVKVADILNA